MIAWKRILVATDFGEAAQVALTYGRDLACTFGAELHVLHIVDDFGTHVGAFPLRVDKLRREAQAAATRTLEQLVPSTASQNPRTETAALVGHSPADAILRYAADYQIDAIVLGTHGNGPVLQFLIGSVADRVLRGATCPVLVVRHPEREFVVPEAASASARA